MQPSALLFVTLDLAVTWTADSSLLDSPLPTIYIVLIPSIGVLLTSVVKARGSFGKATVYMGWVVGLAGIVAGVGPLYSSALGVVPIVNALLVMVWFFLVGWRLLRLAR